MGELIMYRLGSPAPRTRPSVPIVAGAPPEDIEPCAACGSDDALRATTTVNGITMLLCHDFVACAQRYRQGVSPATYAAGLRGELLAVTP
jgi:hypothetical protein